MAKDLNNEGNDKAARKAAFGYFVEFNQFVNEIRREFPSSDVVVSISPKTFHPFLPLISNNDLPDLFETSIFVSDIVLESDDNYVPISIDTYRKFDRYKNRIWHSSSFYIPYDKTGNWQDLESKHLVFDIYE